MAKAMGCVYCFQSGNFDRFKIGKTGGSEEKRRKTLQTGSFEKLTLYRKIPTENPKYLEKYIHQLLDPRRRDNTEFFNITAGELDAAVDQALSFFQDYHSAHSLAEALQKEKPDETVAEPTEEIRNIYRQLRELNKERFLIDERITLLEDKVKLAIGNARGMTGIASWKWVDRLRFDEKRFKHEHADLHEEYRRNMGCREFRLVRSDLIKVDP
jgi:hypothetical protein